jgi:hypothetical protein
MSPEERAAMHRLRAAYLRMLAAREDMHAAACSATASMRAFADSMVAGEVGDVQQHPDLAELDAQLNGFYGPSPGCNLLPEEH